MAAPSADPETGPVTLINGFMVAEGRDDAFYEAWAEASLYFRAQPGFVSLQLHRAVTPDVPYRWVNVAHWESEADYQAAHRTPEFRRLLSQEKWKEFPNVPRLYEVVVAVK
jgi:heme-degrading monooxygenase HmoA